MLQTQRVSRSATLLLGTIMKLKPSERRLAKSIHAEALAKALSTSRGAIYRDLRALVGAGHLIREEPKTWKAVRVTESGYLYHQDYLTEVISRRNQPTQRQSSRHVERVLGGAVVRLSGKVESVLYAIRDWCREHPGKFPSTTAMVKHFNPNYSSWDRSHMVGVYDKLEQKGVISRKGQRYWSDGWFTNLGVELLSKHPKPAGFYEPRKRIGGGVNPETGGTRFPKMLFSVDDLTREELVPSSDPEGKLGARVSKAAKGGRQKGLPVATWSLEEGRTCDPECSLLEVCFAGKMARQKRVLYEGEKTDKAFVRAICKAGPRHYRINTVGDIPTQTFLEGVFSAIAVTGSTAFGYTHWQPESELGGHIRKLSDWHWNFFSVRTSISHGVHESLPERAAVTMVRFDKESLRAHDAIPCPEQQGKVKNCASCGLCWTTRRNIAFELH